MAEPRISELRLTGTPHNLAKIFLVTSLSPYFEILAILPSAVAKIQDCPNFILFH
jgi:hypothetical protein